MNRLNIYGASSTGREVYSWMHNCGYTEKFNEIQFIDDNTKALEHYNGYPPINHQAKDFIPDENDTSILAIEEPRKKIEMVSMLCARGIHLSTFIHPSVVIGTGTTIGKGSILCPNVVVSTDVKLEDYVFLNVSAVVGHDAGIGRYSTLSAHALVMGFATIGEAVFVGGHGIVLPKVLIGDHATVGVGSAVLRKVEPKTTVLGVPAKPI
jgi:sugar O-acyltransferase (sialic acid O-acetyltransferase NeuD family)